MIIKFLNGTEKEFANLLGADLRYADLQDVNLWDCMGDSKRIRTLQAPEYTINVLDNTVVQIGCERHTLDEWIGFSACTIKGMDGQKALACWKKNKVRVIDFAKWE